MIYISLILAIASTIFFYKKVKINKVIKFICSIFIFCLSFAVFGSILCGNEIAEDNKRNEYYESRLQFFADSLNTFYNGEDKNKNGKSYNVLIDDCLLDSLQYYYDNINDDYKDKFFIENQSYYRVNKILGEDNRFITKYEHALVNQAENCIKENMNNPNSFELVGYNISYHNKNEEGYIIAHIKYRSTNLFNAVVTEQQSIVLNTYKINSY